MRLAPLYQQQWELDIQAGLQRDFQQKQQLIIRLLNRRVGEIESSLIQKVQELSVEQLEELGEALLDFTSVVELESWLLSVEYRTWLGDKKAKIKTVCRVSGVGCRGN